MEKRNFLLPRHRRILLLLVVLFVAGTYAMSGHTRRLAVSQVCETVLPSPVLTVANGDVQTLMPPYHLVFNYDSDKNLCYVHFESNQSRLEYDTEPEVTILYSIDGSGYVQFPPDAETIAVPVGSVLKYYAKAPGYNDSPVVTVTAAIPFWNMGMDNVYWDQFGWDTPDKSPITLGEEAQTGLFQMTANGGLVSDYLLTPNENINANFMIRNDDSAHGIYSAESRTYAIPGVKTGGYIMLDMGSVENIPSVTPLAGVELDPWDSECYIDGAMILLKVTATGTARFTVNGGTTIMYLNYFEPTPPQTPTFYLSAMDGASRTYNINCMTGGATIHYTTAVADRQPALDSGLWSSYSNGSATVTVSGQGWLYAYASNAMGVSDVDSVYVNGVELTLNIPFIYDKSYDSDTRLWTVSLYVSQSSIDGFYPNPKVWYSIDDGEETEYTDPFTIANGQQLSYCTKAKGFKSSPVVTCTAGTDINGLNLDWQWEDSYYSYSNRTITRGDESSELSGWYKLLSDGSQLSNGYLLTQDVDFDDQYLLSYYGIYNPVERTYAIAGLNPEQYLYVYTNDRSTTTFVTAVEGMEYDGWNSSQGEHIFKVTTSGAVKFRISAKGYLRRICLYQEPQYGYVSLADANGNTLQYYYESADADAAFCEVLEYASDESKAGHIVIADKVTDRKGHEHSVTRINNNACSYSEVKSVTLPATITEIGHHAFSSCASLTAFDFGDASSVIAIPNYCFSYCSSLETLTLPNSVKTVGSGAFNSCSALRELTFGTGLESNGFASDYYLFSGCSNMEKMVLPGMNFPFQCQYYGLPTTMTLYVDADMVDTYKGSDYTNIYHIIAIGATTDFAVETTEGGELAMKLPVGNAPNAISLTVSGFINGTDVNYIRQSMPYLQELILTNARIVEGGEDVRRWSVSNGKVTQYGSYSYPVVADQVCDYMFYNMPQLKHIALPAGATRIGKYALSSNGKLERADLPAALTVIDDDAFYSDSKLSQADIPAGVTSIGNSAFSSCSSLTAVILPDVVETIGEYAFSYCENLESINIPSKVKTIGNSAFNYDTKLKSPIVIPATCTSIGNSAFYSNYNIPSVTFSEGLVTIGSSAFQYCSGLKTVTLPESLTSLGSYAFANIDSLTTFTFPTNIKQVPSNILSTCRSLESVTLAAGTMQIGSSAFYYCDKLATINIDGQPLTRVDYQAFAYTAFTAFTLPESLTTMEESVFSGCSLLESANIPAAITKVPSGTFQGCEKLASVTLHDNITSIDYAAFSGCKLLPSIALTDKVTNIGSNAFSDCENLVLESLPSSLKTIEYQAFRNTKAINITLTLPETLTTLGTYAFQGSGITGIVFTKTPANFYTYVFQDCQQLASVTLPVDITTIPDYTFYGTTALKTIDLPQGVTKIGNYAFYQSGLESIVLPQKLQTIGSYAFFGTRLTEMRVPKNVTSVGSRFAGGNKNLKTAYLGRKQNYGNNSYFDYFIGCDSLELLRVYAGTPPAISSGYNSLWTGSTYSYLYYTGYRSNCVLEVPEGTVDIYKAAAIWTDFKDIRVFKSDDELNYQDFLVLKDLYNRLDGASWSQPWDLGNQSHAIGKWPGVTTEVDTEDDELFYITAIDLTGRGLTGQLPKSVFTLERLTSLNLSHNTIEALVDTMLAEEYTPLMTLNMECNHLKGDLYPLVSKLPNLTSLNVSYNWLTEYSKPTSNAKLDNYNMRRGFQFIDWQTKEVNVPEELVDEVVIDFKPGTPINIPSNTLQTYRHEAGDYNLSFSDMYRLYKDGNSMYITQELTKKDGLWDLYSGSVFKAKKGLVAYTHSHPYYSYISYILRIDWEDGDVNADQTVDVADLQNVVYYALNDDKPSGQVYNYSAADANADGKINVSDIVGNVNFILSYEEPAPARERINNNVADDGRNQLSIEGGSLLLAHADAVAALQLTIAGVRKAQLTVSPELKARFSVTMRDVDGGVRLVAYSPAGNTLAPGECRLLTALPEGAIVTDARLVDSEAQRLGVTITTATTGIYSMLDANSIMPNDNTPIYDLSGRRTGSWSTLPSGVYIIHLNGKQYKVKK